MDLATDPDRDAIVALLDQTIRAEARADTPTEADRRDWLHGSVDPVEFTEPDDHGWMGVVPAKTEGWIPRALVFWRTVLSSGGSVRRDWMREPVHSLGRWPAIEEAVGDYLFARPDIVNLPGSQS